MTDLPRAFALALGQLGDPAIMRVLGKSLAITLLVFAGAGALLWWAIDAAIEAWIVANLPADYSGTVAGLVAVSVGLVAAWLLFRMVALAVLQFFADDVVRAVERRHYSAAAAVPDLPFSAELAASGRGLLRVIAVNALVLPLALLLLVTGIGPALLLWAANAWLLGLELTEMVWLRHRSDRADLMPVGSATRFALGGITAALLMVPFVNLLAPVLGAAAATHLVHRRRGAHA